MKRNFQPSIKKKLHIHGFRKRMKSKSGKKIILNKINKHKN